LVNEFVNTILLDKAMDIKTFAETHLPALETDEARHNLILYLISRALNSPNPALRIWSLGPPGACAVQSPGRSIVLGELDEQHCHELALQVAGTKSLGVIGPENTAVWFADSASNLGASFGEPIPQQIKAIHGAPCYPGADGAPRPVTAADANLFSELYLAFCREAVPHDLAPDQEELQNIAASGRYLFWAVDGEPVSLAGIARQTRHGVVISGVYTPPKLRGRGYAGSVTAAIVERAYGTGKSFVCLYTDLRNPYSNKCYAKVGFKPVCNAWHYPSAT
jgi:GNAT superfamily N-acetyltransferase